MGAEGDRLLALVSLHASTAGPLLPIATRCSSPMPTTARAWSICAATIDLENHPRRLAK